MSQLKTSEPLQLCQHCDLPMPVLSGLTINIWFVIIIGSFLLILVCCLFLALFLPFAMVPFIGFTLLLVLVKYMAKKISQWHSDKPPGSFNWLLAQKLSIWFHADLSIYLRNKAIVMPAQDMTAEFLNLTNE